MNRRRFSFIFVIALMLLLSTVLNEVLAAETIPAEGISVAVDDDSREHTEQKEQVRIMALNKGKYQSEDEIFQLEGDVRIEKGELVITSDVVSIDMNSKIARISGNIKLTQGDVVITSEALTVSFSDNRAEFVGSVRLINEDDALELVADLLELNTDTEDFICEGNVSVVKDKNRIYSDSAEYSKTRNEFRFSENVYVETDNDEILKAPEVIMYVSTNSFEAVGGVEVSFFIDSKKE